MKLPSPVRSPNACQLATQAAQPALRVAGAARRSPGRAPTSIGGLPEARNDRSRADVRGQGAQQRGSSANPRPLSAACAVPGRAAAPCASFSPLLDTLEPLLLGDFQGRAYGNLQRVPWDTFFAELSKHPQRAALLRGLTDLMVRDSLFLWWTPLPHEPMLLKNALSYARAMQRVPYGARRMLQPALETLLRYPVPALREALVDGLARSLARTEDPGLKRRVQALVGETHTAAQRHVFLAKLALLVTAPEALDQPEVHAYLAAQRRCSSDGAKLRQVIAGILALGARPALLQAVLGQAEPTPTSVQRTQELLCVHEWLQALEVQVDDASATDLPALQQAVHSALGAALPADAGLRWTALVDSWRAPQHLVALATAMRSYTATHPGDSTAWPAFRRLMSHLSAGTYATARAASPQLAALAAAGADADTLQAWQQGATTMHAESGALWHLADSDDASDFVNSGMDVAGSCMRVDSHEGYNQALMGRMLDGARRMLVLRQEGSHGRVLARAMWRLLSDDHGAPVALLSRCYLASGIDEAAAKQALLSFARQRGEDLEVPVACASLAYPDAFPFCDGDLHLLGCDGAADYLDERAGLATEPVRLDESTLDSLRL